MVAEVVSVVGREDNQGVVEPSRLPEQVKDTTDVVIDLMDQSHVGGDHGIPVSSSANALLSGMSISIRAMGCGSALSRSLFVAARTWSVV